MIYKHSAKFILILTLATLACGLASPASVSPTPAPVQDVSAADGSILALDAVKLLVK